MTDYADTEVKGIARYIPTNLSKAILLLLPGVAWFTFAAIREHPAWFCLQSFTELEQTLIAALAALTVTSGLVVVLVLDMAIAVHHSKHRRIVHYSNEHPNMSAKFMLQNANVKHWLILGTLCGFCFFLGYAFSRP